MSNTWTYNLSRGHSEDPSGGACAMDAVHWLVHGKHGDEPEGACPVIGKYVIVLNDAMPDDQRQRLLSYLHRIAGSRSPAHEQARAEILVRSAVRVLTPLALDAAGLTVEAARLRTLPADCTMAKAAEAAEAAAAEAARVAAEAALSAEAWAAALAAARGVEVTGPAAWDAALAMLDEALSAGPQGEPWSAVQVDAGMAAYRAAGGRVTA